MVMPGVAGLASVLHWHGPVFLEHPLATNGELVGNPVHEEALFIARMARPDFILDVTLDGSKQINGVFAGDMEAAWEAGVAFSAQQTTATIAEPVDIVLTTSGGYPLDLTYYQVVKGMVGALPIVKPGGTIVLAAACAEGVGNPVFRENLLRWKRLEDFMDSITRPGAVFAADQWQIEELARCVRHNEVVHVCEGIDRETHERLFVRPADSVEAAMAYALRKHGANATIAAIPAGPYVTAKLAG
jgi:nickel-dependent lactate racemase